MTTMKSLCLSDALEHLRSGRSVIPLWPRSKKSAIAAWESYQTRLATEVEARGWWEKNPNWNIAVINGQISGLLTSDADPRHGGDQVLMDWAAKGWKPEGPMTKTGNAGLHSFMAYPSFYLPNRTNLAPGIELRANNLISVLPPSIHPNGNAYTPLPEQSLFDMPLPPVPDWLLSLVFEDKGAEDVILFDLPTDTQSKACEL